MKRLAIVLFLLILSCKNEPKPELKDENGIDRTVYEMWNNFISSNPEFQDIEMPEAWYFHNNKKDADRLADFIVGGKKKAFSSLYYWYQEAEADLPTIGTKHIITDFEGKAQAIIEIKKVDIIPFNEISKAYAQLDMGTDIEPLEKWKKAHWNFFANTLEENGEKPTKKMQIVCQWFETIWK